MTDLEPHFDCIAAGETEIRPPRTDDPFWAMLVGGTYEAAGQGVSVRHLHPLHAKPVFDSVRGTPVADVMAGLLFRNMITWNSAQHAWDRMYEVIAERDDLRRRLTVAEASLAGAGDGRPPSSPT